MPWRNKEDLKKSVSRRCGKLKSAERAFPLLEKIMRTYMTEDLMDEYNIKDKKRKYLTELIAKEAKTAGNKFSAIKIPFLYPSIPALNIAHQIMRENAEKCPITHMDRFLEQDVKNMIQGKNLEKLYPKSVDAMIVEIREIFITMTHEAGVNFKVNPHDRLAVKFEPAPYKYMGKTERYELFLKRQQCLKSKWVLYYPLIRKIHSESVRLLPEKIFDLGMFHYPGLFELPDLALKFNELANIVDKTLHHFREKIVALIENDKTKVETSHVKHYYKATTTLQAIHVSNLIARILEHIIEACGSRTRVPFLMLTLHFEGNLVLKPSSNDTSFIYRVFMDQLVDIGKKYQTIEKQQREWLEKTIFLQVTEDYFEFACARMQANIECLYDPVVSYVRVLDDLFHDIYADIKEGTRITDDPEMSCSNGLNLMGRYKEYLNKATNLECTESFSIGELVLSEYIKTLKESLSSVIEDIFVELTNIHQTENEDICDAFSTLTKRALKRPSSTQELIQQGKYMLKVKTVIIQQLRDRIQILLNILASLLDYGTLTREHMELNARTVKWLSDIEIVLEQYSAMYEAIKFEAEEAVHKSIAAIKERHRTLIMRVGIFNMMDDIERCREYVMQLAPIMVELREIKRKIEWTNREESYLGFALSEYPDYDLFLGFVYPFYHLVKMCLNLKRKITVWMDGQFEFLSYEETETFIEDHNKEFLKLFKSYKAKIRQAQQDNAVLRFTGISEDIDSSNWPSPLKLCHQAVQMIKDFRPAMTMMRIMCNEALLKRHWKEMTEIAGFDLTPNAGTSLRKMLQMGLEKDIDQYDVISNGATKERELLTNLTKMKTEWQDIRFKVGRYKETGLPILTSLDDIQVILDDHIIKALTMRGSVFVKPYETEVREFYAKLLRINSTIEEWGKVQAQWLYLLPIFSSKDIVAQMPEEGLLFREVNDTFKKYMEAVVFDSRVIESAGSVGVLEAMQHCLELLELINEGVTNYLERKRLFFPRFFFLSNDEMLEILSETKDPLRVQPHLKKCFEAINKLQFDENLAIHEMISMEDERVKFKNIVNTKEAGGSVEKWLILVESQMVISIRDQIIKSNKHYTMVPRTQWITKWQGQIVLCVSQMHWTADVTNSLNHYEGFTIPDYAESLSEQLKDTVSLIRDPKLSNLNRITIKALIVIDVHAKDVVEDLLDKDVQNDKEFKWLCQLRYYLEEDEALVRLINATVIYAYEYLGNSDRLVITPLTDRCYRTLIGAYHLHLNGAPEGPAGTGKTETTKDLAKALAVQCVVFNCSDGLDYKAMSKFFKGLASCGAWVCFDEFNRIDIEVLSVVAQQILSIILAVRAKAKTFLFEGTELKLNPTCYVCITMNPGYAGRTELPDNLKVLFRTVAMMVPDYAMIGEISLYSFGFIDARNLSVKIVTTYRLCSEQLSSQNHYDYGMRAVKSVLSAAGNNKRAAPNENESILLLRAILDVNLPKFLSHDLPLFSGIISDLFPGVVLPQADYKLFTKTMTNCCKEKNLQPKDTFIVKVIQTYEMMIVRHGFMIVGQPFAGKTSTLKILADTLTALNLKGIKELKVQYKFLNPKSITMGQLYGEFDPISYEWFDGVVSNTFRDFAVSLEPDRKWIIFDGPVDAVWIENMNSALDDNKKLCLMCGEVITMTSGMSLIFEVMDLEQASPATVSRCGMIFMEPSSLGWRPIFDSWLPNVNPEWCTPERQKFITDAFEWFIPPCIEYLRKKCVMFCNPGDIALVKNTMNLLQMYMDDACAKSVKKEEDFKYLRHWTEASLLMAITWGLAGILDADSRIKFDLFLKKLFANENSKYPIPETIGQIEVLIPQENSMSDYAFIYKSKGSWKFYPETVKYKRVEEAQNLQQILVPTVDTSRYMSLMKLHVRNKQPFLLVGPTGTGKSFYVQDLLLNKIDTEQYEPGFITFTVQITCTQTQNLILSKLNKRRRGVYGPPKGKLAVLFIDDVNMPQKEIYGAQPPIELLRQYFDHKNWYDLRNTEPIYLKDIMLCAAMGLVGGSRQEVYARFLRHFSILSINEFNQESMAKIYVNILHIGWKNNGFPSDCISTVNQVVNASLQIYNSASENLRPTPSKSHYVFNLRDFSRLILGCAMLRKESVTDEVGRKIFPRIWVHEVLRVFYDRLIEQEDKDWVFNQIKIIVRDFFREAFESVFDNLPKNENDEITQNSMKSLMFGTYFDQDSAEEDRKYEQASNFKAFEEMAQNFLDDYNASHKNKMDIVLFDYALEHLSKICRILSMPCGSGLLVGISGSGRQSLTRLASEIYQLKLFQPEITKNYSLAEWRDDIKKTLKESGGSGRNCVFLIAEGQIKEEVFLQDIDCLINSGEVPNIYQIDEKQEILDMVRLAAQGGNRNLDISALTIFFFFTRRCKEKLHIMLCFSPVGSTFRNRLRLFPSLINGCTIDWFDQWPGTALTEVARTWMGEVNLSEEVKDYCIEACQYFHLQASQASDQFYRELGRKTYITSASYLELIKSFTILTNTKQQELLKARNRYLGGLEKLQHAASSISVMQTQLASLQPELQEMSEKATVMRTQIEEETISVEKATGLVKEDEKVANRQAAAAQCLKKECEADLAEALPILNDALAALDTLKPADITLVKSMKNPPAAIKLVLSAVCIIKDIKPDRIPEPGTGKMVWDYWGPSKRMLGDINFLQGLKDFDKDNIKPEIMARIRKEFIPNKDFRPEVVAKASSAAEGLCKWIIAMDKYDKVWKVVAPKKAKLDAAEKEFAETMAILTAKKNEVARLEAALADLNEKLEVATKRQEDLQSNVDLCNAKLFRAQKLIGGLGGEKTRWTEAADNLLLKYEGLAGDILISVGIISYLSPFNAHYRQDIVAKWHKHVRELNIPSCEEFDFISVLGIDVLIQNWNIYGLPRDTFSIENGIIMANSRRWSLFIDPQSQASTWIKKMEKKNNLVVLKFSYPDYMKRIEVCIQTGAPVLIDGIEETLEAPLDPILYKKIFKQAGMEVISLGENVIEFNKKFRLYMCSKLRNPHYLPEIFNKVTIVNFALTLDGLQDQLLGIVVAVENPDLQQLKEELIVQKAENKATLLKVEGSILKTLAESKGDILEDETAIRVLDESRLLSIEITEKQEKSLEIEIAIEESRVKYTSVSQHSSVLYYCISDLANVDPMYQYSLEWFINLYIGSIQKSEKFRIIEKRCQSLINGFTYDLYSNITRSLFEKDKLLFSFLLCAKILMFQNKLHDHDLIFLLTGGVGVENHLENPTKWLPPKSWDELCRASSNLPAFHGFLQHFTENHAQWKQLYDNLEPHTVPLPAPWNETMSSFTKLIVIRILRPDKILVAITQFVKFELGEKFIVPPQFNIGLSFAESYSLSPLIFILSPGTDPMSALVKFAEEKKFTERFQSISLGQGQGPIAAAMIESAQAEGVWICLQNCHLATSWMPTLEKIFEDIDYSNTHEFFRLWLTSYPSDKFPVTLLQKGVKMTNEPPTGLQQNLLKSYTSDPVKNQAFFYGCPNKEVLFARLLYGIAFFHAVVQERRTFGALGWNIPYGFNDSDFHISVQQVQMFINESENPYEALSYLIGECNYGGRVTDDWDRRLIVTILEDFLSPQVATNFSYKFVNLPPAYYALPKDSSYDDYINFINGMPQMHPPEAFGLHTNAGITKDLQNSNILLNSVLKAYGEGSTSGGEDTDLYLMTLTSDILGRLPNIFDLEVAKASYPVVYNESMNTVLVQEMERFNKLLIVIRATLINLQRAIKGLVAMSPTVEAFSTSLLLSRIPESWMAASYPSLKNLPNYVADFMRRIEFLQTWFDDGKPKTYWVSGFYFTQAFLTGVKQNYARKYTIPIDKITYDFEVLKDDNVSNAPADGAYIYGLFTDGARWNRQQRALDELLPKVLNESMPSIWVKPTKFDDLKIKSRYTCPVYKTSSRRGVLSTTGHSTNYVLPILLETKVSTSHWIKRSVALLCQQD